MTVADWLAIAAAISGAPPEMPILAFATDGTGYELVPWKEDEAAYLLKCPDREALHLGLSATAAPWGRGETQ